MDALWQALNSWTALRLVRTANYAFLAYALCQSAYFQTVVWRTRSLHPNLRFFLAYTMLVFRGIGLSRVAGELAQWLWPGSAALPALCGLASALNAGLTGLAEWVSFSLAVERTIATRHFAHYEYTGATCARLYVLFALVYATLFAAGALLYDAFVDTHVPNTTTCVVPYRHVELKLVSWLVLAQTTGVSLLLLRRVYRRNRALRQAHEKGLSSRFQVQENMHVLHALVPVLAWGVLFIGNLGLTETALLFYEWYWAGELRPRLVVLMQVNAFVVDLAPLGYELIFLSRLPALRSIVARDLACLRLRRKRKRKPAGPPAEQLADEYFRQFRTQWM